MAFIAHDFARISLVGTAAAWLGRMPRKPKTAPILGKLHYVVSLAG
jgi:hypothetical protein